MNIEFTDTRRDNEIGVVYMFMFSLKHFGKILDLANVQEDITFSSNYHQIAYPRLAIRHNII